MTDNAVRDDKPVRTSPVTFYRQVVAELRKVIWPDRGQMVKYTIAVLIFVSLMGALVSPSLRVEYDVSFWIWSAVALFVTALLASLLPAWRAARVPPADTLSGL